MATEIAMVYPVILLMILGAVQLGMAWYARHVAHTVADTALDTARAEQATEAQAEAAAAELLDQLGGGGLLTDVTVEVDRTATEATVRVEGEAAHVVPGLSLPVVAQLTGPVDRFVPDGG